MISLKLLPWRNIIYGILAAIMLYGGYKLYNYHVDAIAAAVLAAEESLLLDQERARNDREDRLLEEAKQQLNIVETQLKIQKKRVTNLEKQLLIDHDLDRLLQLKPGLIIPRVNKATEEYLKELEEVTK